MLSGIYDAALGMMASRQAYEVTAENLANLSVPGYRRSEVSLESILQPLEAGGTVSPIQQGPRIAETATDFHAGPIQRTENPLDLAVVGNGFFVVRGPDGEELYTRNGSFTRGADGSLVTQTGMAVEGESGPITLGEEVAMSQLVIDAQGTLRAKGQEIGTLKLASFDDPSLLQRAGTTLFRAMTGQSPNSDMVSVQQGVREMSNVSPVTELVNMVAALRHYEASERALRAIGDAMQLNTSPT